MQCIYKVLLLFKLKKQQMKKHYLLSPILTLILFKVIAQPPAAPTAPPTRSAANVISIYSAAYTNRTGVDFNPNWGQIGFASASEIGMRSLRLAEEESSIGGTERSRASFSTFAIPKPSHFWITFV